MAPIILPPMILRGCRHCEPPPDWFVAAAAVAVGAIYLAIVVMAWDMAFGRSWGPRTTAERIVGYLMFAACASPLIVAPAVWWLR